MKKILRLKLRMLARLTVWRYRPAIVGVTGSVGQDLGEACDRGGACGVRGACGFRPAI